MNIFVLIHPESNTYWFNSDISSWYLRFKFN